MSKINADERQTERVIVSDYGTTVTFTYGDESYTWCRGWDRNADDIPAVVRLRKQECLGYGQYSR